jgi:hypothetical protein
MYLNNTGQDTNRKSQHCWLYNKPVTASATTNSAHSQYKCYELESALIRTPAPTSAQGTSSPTSCSAFASYNSGTTYTVYQSSSDNYYNYCHHFTTLATAACKSAFCSGGGSSACANEC